MKIYPKISPGIVGEEMDKIIKNSEGIEIQFFDENGITSEFNFEDEIRIFCVPITEKSVVFLGIIPVNTSKDFKTATRFLFSGIYDSQNFLIQFNSSLCDSQLIDLLKSSLFPIKNRYGDIQNICISMPVMYKNKSGVKILYPYGGTDFGSFMLFTF